MLCIFPHTAAHKEVQFTSNKRHHALFFSMITPSNDHGNFPLSLQTFMTCNHDVKEKFFHTAQLESFLSLFRRERKLLFHPPYALLEPPSDLFSHGISNDIQSTFYVKKIP